MSRRDGHFMASIETAEILENVVTVSRFGAMQLNWITWKQIHQILATIG